MEENISFVKAQVREALIPNSYASASAVGWTMYQKFANAMPLYRQEQDWKQLGVAFTRAILDAFWTWLEQQQPRKGTRFEKAVNYALNRKDTLMTYLEDGHCSFSNNLSENAIRQFTVGRKN